MDAPEDTYYFPLSFAQERLWFLDQLEAGTALYNMPLVLRLRGDLDAAALEAAFAQVVARHAVLRTTFLTDEGVGWQVVGGVAPPELTVETISHAALDERVRAEATRPFSLATGPLVRAVLFKLGSCEHVLALTMHHIVSDAWSLRVIVQELAALYDTARRGAPGSLPSLPIQYADFAVWQREHLEGEELARRVEPWRKALADAPAVSTVAGDRPPPTAWRSQGAEVPIRLGTALSRGVAELARAEGVTPFMVLLATFQVWLARHAGQRDVVVGTPVANRTRRELEGLVGFFVNLLPMRLVLHGDPSLRQVLRVVRESTLEAFAYQDLPFEKLVEALNPPRAPGRPPLFQTLFVLQTATGEIAPLPGVTLEVMRPGTGTAKLDLTLELAEGADGFAGRLEYATALFDHATVEALGARYVRLLEGLVRAPDAPVLAASLIDEQEKARLLVAWNDTAREYPRARRVHELFEDRAQRTPERIAVSYDGRSLTYRELDARSNQLARWLRREGIGPEVLVGLYLERSLEMMVALLGVLKAGGAYLPLDPSYPAERLQLMSEDARVPVVLALSHLPTSMPARTLCLDRDWSEVEPFSAGTLDPVGDDENLVYVIYTSGSTGRPKGVMNRHTAVRNRLQWIRDVCGFGEDEVVLQKTPFGFDVSVVELFWPLTVGARIELARPEGHKDPAYLLEVIEKAGVTIIHFVASMLSAFLETPGLTERCGSLRAVQTSGEELPLEVAVRCAARLPGIALHDLYGPTEAAVDVSHHECVVGEMRVPIGRPVPNTQLLVLDDQLGLAPRGAAGELCIAGLQLARGYLGRPDLTAERFVPHPFMSGERMYRTGDRARWLPEGELEYLGRLDNQVKLRGFRIELGEVEAALRSAPTVRDAVAILREDPAGQRRLVAYVTGARDADVPALLAALARRLPDYMVPSAIVVLDELPLNPSGKIDRSALPAPAVQRVEHVAPRTEAERALARVWSEVLRLERVSVVDNFFELGGDSILSIQIVARALREGLHLRAHHIFEAPTIERLALLASVATTAETSHEPVVGPAALTPIEHWFFRHGRDEALHHFNQALLFEIDEIEPEVLGTALRALFRHHDGLRLRYEAGVEGWQKHVASPDDQPVLERVNVSRSELTQHTAAVQAGLALENGPLGRVVLYDLPDGSRRLLVALHHLVVDGVSWRVLLEDLLTATEQVGANRTVALARTSSVQAWAAHLEGFATSEDAEQELAYWRAVPAGPSIARDHDGDNFARDVASVTVSLPAAETSALLRELPPVYRTQMNDALLLALVEAFADVTGELQLRVDLEAHGREALFPELDLTRTVGWFTSIFPVALDLRGHTGPGERLRAVKEQLRAVPRRGAAYGALRELGRPEVRAALERAAPEVSFNYLGRLDIALSDHSVLRAAHEAIGPSVSPLRRRDHLIDVTAHVAEQELRVVFQYGERVHDARTIEALGTRFLASLRALLAHCAQPGVGGASPSDFPLVRLDQSAVNRLTHGADVVDIYPLAPLQAGLLFHAERDTGSGAYLEQSSLRLEGDLDDRALERACRAVLARHESLRAGFVWEGLDAPVQVVLRHVGFDVRRLDLRGSSDLEGALTDLRLADRAIPFALDEPPLLRATLARVASDAWELVWSFHHILFDGWSLALVIGEVLAGYEAERAGREAALPAAPQFRDHLAWLAAQAVEPAERYFRALLSGMENATPLGMARGRVGATMREMGEVRASLSPSSTAQLQAAAASAHLTLNTCALGAWGVLLSRYGGGRDVVFGATTSGRSSGLARIERMVGLFINTVPVRLDVGVATMRELLEAVQTQQAQTRDHEHLPLTRVQAMSDLPRGEPLFESLLVFENYPVEATERSTLRVVAHEMREQTSLPLVITITPEAGLRLRLQFDRERISDEIARRVLTHFESLLVGIAERFDASPSMLPMLTVAECARLEVLARGSERANELPAVHELFAAQVARTPDAIALIDGGLRVTFAELAHRSDALASRLLDHGVGRETPVGVCVRRSVDMVVAVLGVLRAGALFVPLDPEYPTERLELMLDDSGAQTVVVHDATRTRLATGARLLDVHGAGRVPPPVSTRLDQAAYIIYTSGSTGRPKGVTATHRATTNRVAWMLRAMPFGPDEVACQKTALSFVDSIWEIFGPLAAGIPSVIIPDDVLRDPDRLVAVLSDADVTRMVLVPSLMRTLLESHGEALASRLPKLRRWTVSGEALDEALADLFARMLPASTLLDLYGSSEIAGDATCDEEAATRRPVSVGRPIDRTRTHILDTGLALVPEGVVAELYVGGDNVARGYWGRPDLTAERFVPDPYSRGQRLYRTGDLARWSEAGVLELVGRADHQVKIRGVRVELGEIESVLRRGAGVTAALVLARRDGGSDARLVAYAEGEGLVSTELLHHLSRTLPAAMVPAHVIVMPRFPLTPNGKVDRSALPAPGRAADLAFVAPRTRLERELAAIWRDVLGVDRVGVGDGFFALGGDSLSAVRVVSRARSARIAITVRGLFERPTIERVLQGIDTQSPLEEIELRAGLATGAHPLSFWQARTLRNVTNAGAIFNVARLVPLAPDVAAADLEHAIFTVVARHAVLRTTFEHVEGTLRQVVHDTLPIVVAHEAARPEESFAAYEARIRDSAMAPFDLAHGPLLRVTVWSRGASRHVLVVLHHIVCDAWSVALLAREVRECLDARRQGRGPRLPPLELQYADYARWQVATVDRELMLTNAAYWRALLRDARPARIPTGSSRDGHTAIELDARLVRELEDRVQLAQVTMFTIVLCAWLRVLADESGEPDQVVGFPISTRDDPRLEPLIGYFVNHLCVRVRVDADRDALIEAVRGQIVAAHAHKDVSLDEHLDEEQRARLYRFRLNFIAGDAVVREPADGEPTGHVTPRLASRSPFDLSLDVDHRPGALWLGLRHSGLSDEDAQRILGRVVEELRVLGTE